MRKRLNRGATLEQLMGVLKKSVIGQEGYLKKIAVTVWLHNKRIEAINNTFYTTKLQKHNLLCVGPTGSGKTLAVSILADIYGMDVLVADMSSYTGTGWKGKDIDEMIKELYEICGRDKERTERAIVVMDEIDKMVLQKDGRDQSFATENSLLKIIEGTKVDVGRTRIDTQNILFIGAGAFEGIEYLVKKRVNEGKMGFKPTREDYIVCQEELLQHIERQDVIGYGMGAQLMGRFSDIAILRKLNVHDFKRILLESEVSVVKSLNETLHMSCGIQVTMDEAGAEAVSKQAIREGTGARSLAQIIFPVVHEVMFIVDDEQTVNGILLTADEEGEPIVKLQEGERFLRTSRCPFEIKYQFPQPKRKNVEHFCWHLLSVYLDKTPETYQRINAMHKLLCSIVFYVLRECASKEHTIMSIQKLVSNSSLEPGCSRTIYEVLLSDCENKECHDYYRQYKCLDSAHQTVSQLQKALVDFTDNPCLPSKVI